MDTSHLEVTEDVLENILEHISGRFLVVGPLLMQREL